MIAPQLVVELSRTVVARADIASASVDDAVVFDEAPAVAASDRWPVVLRIGNKMARAVLLPDGKLTVVEGGCAPEQATKVDRRHAERTAGGAEIVAEIARFAGAQLA